MAKKRKISLLKVLQRVVLGLIAIFIAAFYIFQLFDKPPHVKYPAFGIDIPPNYIMHGIDVSHYQHLINWQDVKEMKVDNIQIGFAYIKATEGLGKVDDQFGRNWSGAEEAGIPKGAYHYFIAGKSGKAQADNFIEIVKLRSGDLPPALDVEETYNVEVEKMKQEINEWLQRVQAYYNVKPIIYTNIDFYKKYLKGYFDDYAFWFANYLQPEKPSTDQNWIFWQHSEQGRVNGIKTPVDFNVFAGDSLDFKNLLLP